MTPHLFDLQPFPSATTAPSSVRVSATMARQSNRLSIRYKLEDTLSQVLIPARADIPTRKDKLWEETCFEFFLGLKNSTAYWEFNLSPSGHWNVYCFDFYRRGMKEETRLSALPFEVNRSAESLELGVEIDLGKIVSGDAPIQVGITTVLKLANGDVSYWAIAHCGEQPDFHLRESFIVEM